MCTLLLRSRWPRICEKRIARHHAQTIAEQSFHEYYCNCSRFFFKAGNPECVKTKLQATAQRQLPNNLFRAYQYICSGVVFEAGGPESMKTKFRANARRQLATHLFVRITIVVHAFPPKQVAQNFQKTNCASPGTDNCGRTFLRILLQLLTPFSQSKWPRFFKTEIARHRAETIAEQQSRAHNYTCSRFLSEAGGPDKKMPATANRHLPRSIFIFACAIWTVSSLASHL